MLVGGMPHIVRKLSMRALLQTSFQSEVWTRSYGLPKWQKSQFQNFWKFRDFQLGSREKNDIWVQPLWLVIDNTIKGMVVASPKSKPW